MQHLIFFCICVVLYAAFVSTIKPVEAVLSVVILLFSIIVQRQKKTAPALFSSYFFVLCGYTAAVLVSCICASGLQTATLFVVKLLPLFIGIASGIHLVEERFVRWSLAGYLAGSLVLAVIALIQYFFFAIERPPSFIHPIHAGYALDYTLLLLVALFFHGDTYIRRHCLVLAAAVAGGGLLVGGSRGAWLAFLIASVAGFVASRSLVSLKRAIVLVVLVIAALQHPFVKQRIDEAYADIKAYSEQGYVDSSLGARFEMWRVSLQLFQEKPLLGVGATRWQREVQAAVQHRQADAAIAQFNQPHNMYLFALATTGAIGFVAFLLLAFFPVWAAWRHGLGRSWYGDALFLISIAFLVQGLTDSVQAMHRPFQSYLLLVGILMAGMQLSKSASREVS